MATDNKLELVVEVDVNKANASIKSVNTGLSSMEQAASKAAHGASAGIDGMTASMVKGATAGNLLADAIKKGIEWAKDWTLGAVQMAAHEARVDFSMLLGSLFPLITGAGLTAARFWFLRTSSTLGAALIPHRRHP